MRDFRFSRSLLLIPLLLAAAACGGGDADTAAEGDGASAPSAPPGGAATVVDTVSVPVPHEEGGAYVVEREFQDSLGRKPVSLRVKPDSRASVTFVDSTVLTQPVMEQRRQAQAIARRLWDQYGRAEGVDTVVVTFTNREDFRSGKTEQEFFFYPSDLGGAGSR